MVVLDVDHPDIEDFIETKAQGREQDPRPARRRLRHGPRRRGHHLGPVPERQQLRPRQRRVHERGRGRRRVRPATRGSPARPSRRSTPRGCSARSPRPPGSAPTPACSTTTRSTTGTPTRRRAASPQATRAREYLSLDNSSCNLASLNLLKFLKADDTFDAVKFAQMCELIITAMDISITLRRVPDGEDPRHHQGLPPARHRLRQPRRAADGHRARLRLRRRPRHRRRDHQPDDRERVQDVAPSSPRSSARTTATSRTRRRTSGSCACTPTPAPRPSPAADVRPGHPRPGEQDLAGVRCVSARPDGYRNAQASLLAPTGTIGFMMDCDTTGIEPDLALVKFKKLVGGGSMQIVNQTVPRALKNLGYQARAGRGDHRVHRRARPRGERARPRPEHYEVFDCAMGERVDQPDGPRPDDGRGPAVPFRLDLQDGQHAGERHRRGRRADLLRGLEARPEGAGDLPRQLQGRPAALAPRRRPRRPRRAEPFRLRSAAPSRTSTGRSAGGCPRPAPRP